MLKTIYMNTTLFLQSNVPDPYAIYKSMLEKNPVFWDENSKTWAVYSYEYCVEILKNPHALIPAINLNNEQKLNTYAVTILNNLVRLSNGISHEINREIACFLFSNMTSVNIDSIISELIEYDVIENKIDWVDSVCKKLPVLVVLKSFGFKETDCNFILEKMESLIKIMLPNKTQEQVNTINKISEELFSIVEKQLLPLKFYRDLLQIKSAVLSANEIKTKSISNVIGLLIQSYDAGRGILSTSLLQILNNKSFSDKAEIQKSVIETLRFDPPIHNTRRIAEEDIYMGESLIRRNDPILIVLASANRDPQKFENALVFDIERRNNTENLTFGTGGHACLAKHFSISLATEAIWFLLNAYKTVVLLENNIEYEPMINARLPKRIPISLK